MGKILGEVFDKYVDEQIKTRQKSLGKSQKSTDDLVVFNSSTPWIRLSSSVEVSEGRAKTLATNLGINQSEVVGRNLAKNLVLFAGTSDGANLSNKKGGVGYGLKSSYGFLSNQKQGYRPMPGVTGISASYKNNGTLKQAQVSLKCFTREQFEAVEALYLRLGYTMILEWGHSVYFDNNNKRRNMSSLEIPNILFKEKLPPEVDVDKEIETLEKRELAAVEEARKANPDLTSDELEDIANSTFKPGFEDINSRSREEQLKKNYSRRLRAAIEENKKKTSGNYDAMVAKVSNFSWSLNDDLSYDITLDLVSVGDIIDSLKMNFGGINITSTNAPQVKTDAGVQNLVAIELASGASAFNSFLYELIKTGEKQVKNETDQATQEQIKLKNKAVEVAQKYASLISDVYIPVIKQLRDQYINPYENVRNVLVGKKVNVGYVQGTYQFELASAEDKKELEEALTGKLERLGELESKYRYLNPSTGELNILYFQKFLKTFDLDVNLDTEPTIENFNSRLVVGTIIKDTKDEVADQELTKTIKDLNTQLDTIQQQVTKVEIRATSTEANQNNTEFLTYLGEKAGKGSNNSIAKALGASSSLSSLAAKNVVLRALFDGFYDKEKHFKSDVGTIDFAVQTTIVRKWLNNEK